MRCARRIQEPMNTANAGFSIGAFAYDGELVGQSFCQFSNLDPEILQDASGFISRNGPVFEVQGTDDGSAVRTKFTSASETAIATVFCRTEIVCSLLILSGHSPDADQAVMRVFTDSAVRSSLSLRAAKGATPFAAIRTFNERPLVVVVTWPVNHVTDDEHQLIRTHSLHLAGAFLRRAASDET